MNKNAWNPKVTSQHDLNDAMVTQGPRPTTTLRTSAAASAPSWNVIEANRARVVRARMGRAAFGAVLLTGACVLVFQSVVGDLVSPGRMPWAWQIVMGTWCLALCAAVLVPTVARWCVVLAPRVGPDDGLLVASLALPAAGLVVWVPITLHMPVVLAYGGALAFDLWCTRGFGVMAHAHLVLAVVAAYQATQAAGCADAAPGLSHRGFRRIKGSPASETTLGLWMHTVPAQISAQASLQRGGLDSKPEGRSTASRSPLNATSSWTHGEVLRSSCAVYVLTILVSAMPFGAAYVLPPVLVALTALPLLALMGLSGAFVAREGRSLGLGVRPGDSPA